MWAFWVILKSLLESLLTSRVGQLAIVAGISWFWSAHNTADHWRGIIAQEKAAIEAAYRAEVARQEEAAREIAAAATERAETDAQVAADMRKIISDYEKKMKEKPHVSAQNCQCVIDDDFSGVVRRLSDTGNRKSPAPGRARRVRAPR